MKRKNKFLAVIGAMTVLMSSVSVPVSATGNIKDTNIVVEAVNNSGGTPALSIWRAKKDSTSVWCKNTSNSGGSLKVWVHRSNSKSNSSVNTVDRYYGKWTYNGATKNVKTVPAGTYYYLTNYVYEDSYKYATIGYIMNKENVDYHIQWSPDSI